MFHRPMEGPEAMCLHWGEAENLLGPWKTRGLLMKPIPNPAFVDTWSSYVDAPALAFQLNVGAIGTFVAPVAGEFSVGTGGTTETVVNVKVVDQLLVPPAFVALTRQ